MNQTVYIFFSMSYHLTPVLLCIAHSVQISILGRLASVDKCCAEGPVGGWEVLSFHSGSISLKGRDCPHEEGAQGAFGNDNSNEDVLIQA